MSELKLQHERILAAVAHSVRAARTRLVRAIGKTHGEERDLYETFGYPRSIEVGAMYERYRRGGIESRIIRAFPKATWRVAPEVTDDDSSDKETEFEQAVDQLDRNFSVWHMLERADRLSGIGHYGILLMGFSDGRNPNQPLADGNPKLIYLRPFSERSVRVAELERDPKSPRFGLPKVYNIETQGVDQANVNPMAVHYSRVLHITEFPEEDDIYGTPRLESVYNRLLDIEKVAGGSAEAFWLNANAALALLAQSDADLDSNDIAAMKEQAEEFQHQLRRIFALQGVDVKQLKAQIADPSNHIDALLSLLAGTIGIPKRILVGSERGELASTQDDDNWAAEIDSRRKNYVAPRIVRPFIDKMIAVGMLPQPRGGDYDAHWPQTDTLSETQKADVAQKRATALQSYSSTPIAETIVPPGEFRERFLGLDAEPPGGFPEAVEPDDEGDIEVED